MHYAVQVTVFLRYRQTERQKEKYILIGSLWYRMIQGDRKHYYLPSKICPSSSGYILHSGLQCCTFDYIEGLQRVPTQPLNVHIPTCGTGTIFLGLSTLYKDIGDERRSFFYKRCSNIAWNLHV
jgi:hypothetical protein